MQLREVVSFIESKFEDTFTEEQKVVRSPGAKDTHIHCVLLVLDPARLDAEAANTSSPGKPISTITKAQTLDEEMDLQVIRTLSSRTTVIPVISKADTLTSAQMATLKRNIWSTIQATKLDPLEALGLDEESESDDEEDDRSKEGLYRREVFGLDREPAPPSSPANKVTESTMPGSFDDNSSLIDDLVERNSSSPVLTSPATTPSPAILRETTDANANVFAANSTAIARALSPNTASAVPNSATSTDSIYIPFSILSPDPYTLPHTLSRIFPWGTADPLNPSHCDFARLKESVFGEWRAELRAASREKWYEGWRTSRLKRIPGGAARIGTGRVRQVGSITPASVVPREGRRVSGGSLDTGKKYTLGQRDRARVGSDSSKAEKVLGVPRGYA